MAGEAHAIPPESSHFVSAASLRLRLDWFNKLRWGAAACVLAGTLLADRIIDNKLDQGPLLLAVGALLVLNLLYVLRNRRIRPADIRVELRHVKLQMVGDLVVLTVLLNLTGGIENPLLFMYIIHVIIASLLFKGAEIYQIAGAAIVLFTADVLLEMTGHLPHHHLQSASTVAHEGAFIAMTLASFWLVLLFSAYIGARIMRHNRAIKDELVVRQQALIEADRAKMEFFRFVTHEIKSPVSTAQSAVETVLELGDTDLDDQSADLLRRAVRRLEHATEMVKNLADLTRGGDLKPENLRQVDLNGLVADAAADLSELAARRGIAFDLCLPDPPLVVETSADMLGKIIGNLLSNAVRYNKQGGRVTVSLAGSGSKVLIQVADEGIGIEPEDRGRIFDEFYRSAAAQELSNLGTGLGLPIVKRFVEQLSGRITVASEPGRGSTFTVELPIMSKTAVGPP